MIGDSKIALGLNAVLNLEGTVVFDSIEMNGGDVVIDSNNSGSETLTVDTLIFNSNVSSSQFSGLSTTTGVPDDTLIVTSVVPTNTPIQASNLNLSGGGLTGPLDLTRRRRVYQYRHLRCPKPGCVLLRWHRSVPKLGNGQPRIGCRIGLDDTGWCEQSVGF